MVIPNINSRLLYHNCYLYYHTFFSHEKNKISQYILIIIYIDDS